MFDPDTSLDLFFQDLKCPTDGTGDVIEQLRNGLIGEGHIIDGPFGATPLIYADYVASGRALKQVEAYIADVVLPIYANSHTQASYCGRSMTRLRLAARRHIARICRANNKYEVIFTGAGATHGINRLVHLLGVTQPQQCGDPPLVLIGPYEHHSNILPWRESGAEVLEIEEAVTGGPDLLALEDVLKSASPGRRVIAAFSAASNVTGIVTDVDAVSRLLNQYHVVSVWDYAGGGPYLPIDMRAGHPGQIDAVVLSPHKFIGGPAASGVMIVRKAVVCQKRPTLPGGGTVQFVSPWSHDYAPDLSAREESGTPNVVGDIRAALAFLVKEAIGQATMTRRNRELYLMARRAWASHPQMVLLGQDTACEVLPIFSFRVRDTDNNSFIHQQLFTKMLSDVYGIQARGGCACAGPYAHRLLDIGAENSGEIRAAILDGDEIAKPGWTRLNFSVLMDDAKARKIIESVAALAHDPHPFLRRYVCDTRTARFEATRP